jgi:hypothetical protein
MKTLRAVFRRLPPALLLLLALAAPAAAQRAGLYDIRGTNPDGSAYAGVLQLRQVGIVSWAALWQVGNERIEGVGMSTGNTLALTYRAANTQGFAIYEILPNGTLTGQWTLVGSSGIGTETLTPR